MMIRCASGFCVVLIRRGLCKPFKQYGIECGVVMREEVSMKMRGKTNRLKAALKRKNVKRYLRVSKGEKRHYS